MPDPDDERSAQLFDDEPASRSDAPVAVLDTDVTAIAPGGEVSIPLQIRNNGEIVDQYDLRVVEPDEPGNELRSAPWAAVVPDHVEVFPGECATATVQLRPSTTMVAGRHPWAVEVTPTMHPDDRVFPESVVEVLPFTDVALDLQPRYSDGRRSGRHRLAIDNRSNTPVVVALTAQDDADLLDFAFEASHLEVRPFAADFVSLRVKPLRSVWRGEPLTHRFVVVATPEGAEPLREPGTYQQKALLPAGLRRMLVGAAIALGALVVAWFGIAKPAVEAAARDAVEPQVRAAEVSAETAAQSEQGAAQSEEQAEQSKDEVEDIVKELPGGKPAPSPSPPVPTTFSLPLTAAAGSQATTATAAVAEGSMLEVTDFVFANPRGDFGTLTVSRGGDVLFETALENFRDLDYHLVTPVRLDAGERVTATLSCDTPGTPPERSPAPTCSALVTLGGAVTELEEPE